MHSTNKVRILFLGSGPYSLNRRLKNDKLSYFSETFIYDFITPVNLKTKKITKLKPTIIEDGCNLYPFVYRNHTITRSIFGFYHYLTFALKIYFLEKKKFDVVISGNPLLSGFLAILISNLTKSKSIIEVNGNFESAFKYGSLGEKKAGFVGNCKDKISKYIIKFTLKRADMVKLVSSNQLNSLFSGVIDNNIKTVNFPNFVQIDYFLDEKQNDLKYILLLGFPWYLKGVDILIKAFVLVSEYFPDYKLKIVGWCPKGKEYFEALADGNNRIELCDAVPYKEVIPLMANCSIYVLASRTDSSPRVLREAMASRKPIIASNIDGVPDLIENGYNGLLFESENIEDLAGKIKLLLSNKDLANKLSNNGLKFVKENLSADCYMKKYISLIDDVLK